MLITTNRCAAGSEGRMDNIRIIKDGEYIPQSGAFLKDFSIKDGKKHRFALICPGGAYSRVAGFLEGDPYAEALNRLGISAFVLYYSCGEDARYPAPFEDLAKALRLILDNADDLNVLADGYSLWGSSAGAHLTACFCTEKPGSARYGLPGPAALILAYPVITMRGLTHSDSRKNLLGEHPSEEDLRLFSVEMNVTPDYPPTFLWCGSADDIVDPENSRMMAKALAENGIKHLFKEYAGVGHAVGLGEGLACEGWLNEAVRFWRDCI